MVGANVGAYIVIELDGRTGLTAGATKGNRVGFWSRCGFGGEGFGVGR